MNLRQKVSLSYKKKAGIYTNSTGSLTFNPTTLEAHSYRWWKFVAKVDGKVIFNNYRYSVSTSKHQYKIRELLQDLGIKIDLALPLPNGINSYDSLAEMILKSEEHLCDKYLSDQLKAQDRNLRAKLKRKEKKLENYLENECHFRDYKIKVGSLFGQGSEIAVHQVVDMKDLERDVNNAIETMQKDLFPQIVFYIQDGDS